MLRRLTPLLGLTVFVFFKSSKSRAKHVFCTIWHLGPSGCWRNSVTGVGTICPPGEYHSEQKQFELLLLLSERCQAYEEFVKDTNASIEEKSKDIVNKSESRAKAETDLVEAKENKEATMLELEQLANYKAELHSSCDFVMNNFEILQTARDEEVEALKQAKAFLSGAKFEAFLQAA